MPNRCRCWRQSAKSFGRPDLASCNSPLQPGDGLTHDWHGLIQQSSGVEEIAVLIDFVFPQQMRAALDMDLMSGIEPWMTKTHGPAQISFSLAHLVEGIKVKTQLADIAVQVGEV